MRSFGFQLGVWLGTWCLATQVMAQSVASLPGPFTYTSPTPTQYTLPYSTQRSPRVAQAALGYRPTSAAQGPTLATPYRYNQPVVASRPLVSPAPPPVYAPPQFTTPYNGPPITLTSATWQGSPCANGMIRAARQLRCGQLVVAARSDAGGGSTAAGP